MKRVFKYGIPISGQFSAQLPADAEVLHVGVQAGEPFLWALVDPDAPTVIRVFAVRGTGNAVQSDLAHRGSFMLDEGRFVGHLFEVVS